MENETLNYWGCTLFAPFACPCILPIVVFLQQQHRCSPHLCDHHRNTTGECHEMIRESDKFANLIAPFVSFLTLCLPACLWRRQVEVRRSPTSYSRKGR